MQPVVNAKPLFSTPPLKNMMRTKKTRSLTPLGRIIKTIPPEITPCVDFRLDVRKLLDRTSLLQNPLFRGEQLVKRLFLRGDEKSQTDIWLRIFPQSDHIVYELVDPSAADLKRCDHVFSQITGYQNHVGLLEELAAPSFSGAQTIALVLNVMALGRLEELFLVDGSIRLPCCASGQIASLRMTSVFCNGKSWYEQHGATAKISSVALRFFISKDLYETTATECSDTTSEDSRTHEHLSLEYSTDARLSRTKDLDRIVFEQFRLDRKEFQPSRKAYLFATRFLHTLFPQDLQKSLSHLCLKSPKVQELYKLLEVVSRSSGLGRSLGSTFSEFLRTKDRSAVPFVQHDLLHELFTKIIANKGSIFFQLIAEKLKDPEKASHISLMLSFCVLNRFFEDIDKDTLRAQVVLYALLKAEDEELDFIEVLVKALHEKAIALPKGIFDTSREVSLVKVLSHSTKGQVEQFWSNIKETGAEDEFLTLKKAFEHIVKTPLQQLRILYKDLGESVMQRFCILEESLTAGITLESIMDASGEDEKKWVLDELAAGSLKHLSSLLTQDKIASETFTGDDVYAIFMICKYVVEKHKYFALKL